MSIKQRFFYLLCSLLLAGCDQQAMVERFIPKEEADTAKTLLAQVAAKDYDIVEHVPLRDGTGSRLVGDL